MDWVCKGHCKDTAALHGGGGGLCWMEYSSHTAQASAQLFSEEMDFEGNPIDGTWPNPLPVTCLIALQGGKAGLQSLNALN